MPKASVLGIELLAEQGGLCALCRLRLEQSGVTLDHIIPLAVGGTSARANLQAVHRRCNEMKGNIVDSWVCCWRCKHVSRGELNGVLHYEARHPDGFISVKAWRKAAAAALKQATAVKVKGHARTPKKVKPPRPYRPLPPDTRVPRNPNVPYQTTKLGNDAPGSAPGGIIALGIEGSP